MMPKEERGIALRDNVVSSSSSPDWKTRLNMASFFSFFFLFLANVLSFLTKTFTTPPFLYTSSISQIRFFLFLCAIRYSLSLMYTCLQIPNYPNVSRVLVSLIFSYSCSPTSICMYSHGWNLVFLSYLEIWYYCHFAVSLRLRKTQIIE